VQIHEVRRAKGDHEPVFARKARSRIWSPGAHPNNAFILKYGDESDVMLPEQLVNVFELSLGLDCGRVTDQRSQVDLVRIRAPVHRSGCIAQA
jgi:hypothetical protein